MNRTTSAAEERVNGGSSLRRRVGPVGLLCLSVFLVLALALAATAKAAPDFQILISPANQTLPPGGSVSFTIQIAGIDGFSEAVNLSVDGLPSGVTHVFSTNPLDPSGVSFLTLTADENAPRGVFALTVTGTAGAITHTATGQVTVDFGLIPICYGAAEGVVSDADTGAPLAGVEIRKAPDPFGIGTPDAITDAEGRYRVEEIALGENNSPQEFGLRARLEPTYWYGDGTGIAVCDQTTRVDVRLVRVRPARVSGRIVEGNPDPTDYDNVIPTSTPANGAQIQVYSWTPFQSTGPDGLYDITFRLGHNNQPFEPTLYAYSQGDPATNENYWREGYWERFISLGQVGPDQHVVKEVALVKKCTGSISGQVVLAGSGSAVAGAQVSAGNFYDLEYVHADAQGRFTFPALLLGHNNRPTDYFVSASVPDHNSASATARFEHCGDHKEVTVVIEPNATIKVGSLEGHVYDEETGLAVAGVTVYIPNCTPCTDWKTEADGYYRIENIPVGFADDDVVSVNVATAFKPEYYDGSVYGIEVRVGQRSTADIRILLIRYARVSGTIRDVATKQAIENAHARLSFNSSELTGPDGRYLIQGVLLGERNSPIEQQMVVEAPGHWPKTVSVPLRADTTTEQDVELIPICEDATITGRVVNANTQQPIQGALVTAGNQRAFTDAAGNYRLEGVAVGTDNSPLEVLMTASAPGFFTQQRRITVFCGAAIVIDFGRPPSTAAVEGYVTNAVSGNPIAGVFIGSEFGVAATTNAQGYYKLRDAPVNPDGSPRVWRVTAAPADFESQEKSVTVRANETSRLDFQFGGQEPLPATLVVRKQTVPSGAAGTFSFSASYDSDGFSLADEQSNTSGPLVPGSYSVSESPVSGWDATASCDDGSSPSDIELSADQTVTCTFTNTKRGTVSVRKTVSGAPPSGSESFTFQLRQGSSSTSPGTILESQNASAANGGLPTFATTLVPATTYALCEVLPSGWTTTLGPPLSVYNPAGDSSTLCTEFTVQPGETKTFAIDNRRQAAATLIVRKVTDPANASTAFSFSAGGGLSPASFTLTGGSSRTFDNVAAGSGYSIAESVPAGWELKSATCSDGSPVTSISLEAGETVTCTLTNAVLFAPGGGLFVIGDKNAAIGTKVTFWGAQWWKLNSLSGGTGPAAFKGFAKNPGRRPSCGTEWSTDPGNSAPPPPAPLPAYMGVIVSSSIRKSGSTIFGDTPHIVIVKTNPGYSSNPGHAGTGTVVATVC